jgi:SnoaL-like domain
VDLARNDQGAVDLHREARMSLDQTQRTMDRYFGAMGRHDDFSTFFTADVTWTMMESGQEVRGPAAVRDYIHVLHSKMFEHQQRALAVSDGHAYLEGDCVDAPDATVPRYDYCLVYDLEADQITAMRCYGSIARLMPQAEAAEAVQLGRVAAPGTP